MSEGHKIYKLPPSREIAWINGVPHYYDMEMKQDPVTMAFTETLSFKQCEVVGELPGHAPTPRDTRQEEG